jgi:hypothetical protein
LRWIANWAGSIASRGLIGKLNYQEDRYTGWRYKVNLFIWNTFWPIYDKWGTTYIIDTDMSGKEWDDYDENGHAYWDYDWHEDPITGDAWRLVKKKAGYTGRWVDDDDFKITPGEYRWNTL